MGEALEPYREEVIIATKFGWDIPDVADADTIRRAHKVCPVAAVQSEYSILLQIYCTSILKSVLLITYQALKNVIVN